MAERVDERIDRRRVIAGSLAFAGAVVGPRPAAADPASERVKAGDKLVVADPGADEGKPVTLDMLAVGGEMLAALPADPASGVVRSGSRFNQLVLVRLPADALGDDIRKHAAEGVIAYSAICTHQACAVTVWKEDERLFVCFCHGSEFSGVDAGRVTKGPATRRLPILPLSVGEGGALIVAGNFTGKPGPG